MGLLPNTKSGNNPSRIEILIINYRCLKLILRIGSRNSIVFSLIKFVKEINDCPQVLQASFGYFYFSSFCSFFQSAISPVLHQAVDMFCQEQILLASKPAQENSNHRKYQLYS